MMSEDVILVHSICLFLSKTLRGRALFLRIETRPFEVLKK